MAKLLIIFTAKQGGRCTVPLFGEAPYFFMAKQGGVQYSFLAKPLIFFMEDERADARRDDPTCLARPNFQARTGTEECNFPCSADQEQDWQPDSVDPYSAIICDDHTYIHTVF